VKTTLWPAGWPLPSLTKPSRMNCVPGISGYIVVSPVVGRTLVEGKAWALNVGVTSHCVGPTRAGAAGGRDKVVACPTLGPGKPAIIKSSASVTRLLSRADRTCGWLNIQASLGNKGGR